VERGGTFGLGRKNSTSQVFRTDQLQQARIRLKKKLLVGQDVRGGKQGRHNNVEFRGRCRTMRRVFRRLIRAGRTKSGNRLVHDGEKHRGNIEILFSGRAEKGEVNSLLMRTSEEGGRAWIGGWEK